MNLKAFCIFDDFPSACIKQLETCGVEVISVAKGHPRPSDNEMKMILEEYPIVIIGTSQKIYEWMWENVNSHRIVATASVGIDHILVPENKKKLLTVLNTPTANAQSVAEYTIGAMLLTRKRFVEGNSLYQKGIDNKGMIRKPEDIHDQVIGIVGAGRIATRIMELLCPFGVQFLCATKNPDRHTELTDKYGTAFVGLEELAQKSDVISVNVPNDNSTENLINETIVQKMKDDATFISVSRTSVCDNEALFAKAELNPNFYVVLDMDVVDKFVGKNNGRNIVITPHIAGGTIEARNRMFYEVTTQICKKIRA